MKDAKEYMLEVCKERKEFKSLKLSQCTEDRKISEEEIVVNNTGNPMKGSE
jgi:hypothetical protein